MLAYFVVFAIAFALVVLILSAYVRRVADYALTDPFRAGESIANGHIPSKWILEINRRLLQKRWLPFLQPEASGTKLALQKLDTLYQFFEASSFFENQEARELLLGRLKETRQLWENMSWEEIVKEFGDPSE